MSGHFRALLITVLALLGGQVHATSVLVSPSPGTGGYGYGFGNWEGFSAALDTATGNSVTVGSLNSLATMLSYDALFVDQRWTAGSLSATEIANIADFIATGRRVVMMGENNSWTAWNNQILGIVGGSYAGQSTAATSPVVANELTAGVGSLGLPTAGVASGGTALFDVNFATLWGDNVLTVLDINVFDDTRWDTGSYTTFGVNVANWLAASSGGDGSVPVPAPLALIALGLLGMHVARRRRAAR